MTGAERKQSPSKVPIILVGVIGLVLVGVFVIGLTTKREELSDPEAIAWSEFLSGEWVYVNNNDVEELISFTENQRYAQLLADPQFAHLSREGRYRFVAYSEESATLELLPEASKQKTQVLAITKVKDATMTGDFATDDVDTEFEFNRRR